MGSDVVLSAGVVCFPRFRVKLMLLRPSLGLFELKVTGACTVAGDPIANV